MPYYPPPELKQFACQKCGYDLTGLATHGYCPECGQRYSTVAGENASDTNDTQRKADRILERVRTLSLAGIGLFILSMAALIEINRQINGAKEPWVTSWVLWTAGFLALIFFAGSASSYYNETYRTHKG